MGFNQERFDEVSTSVNERTSSSDAPLGDGMSKVGQDQGLCSVKETEAFNKCKQNCNSNVKADLQKNIEFVLEHGGNAEIPSYEVYV
ncbi:hypothetical protein [Magnetococcus sp. PR-3]|uniref:hypothetical protein n=1 Tax=Magnetococcus sp. PR-3 TaxID=3120355 RepID=UPI002FCDE88A